MTTAFVPEASHFRPSLSNVTVTTAGLTTLSSFEGEEEHATIAVPDKRPGSDECSVLTDEDPMTEILSLLPHTMEELMPHEDVAALRERDATLLEQLSDQKEILGLMDEKLDLHHSEAMESQRRNHSEAMERQRGIMERQSSNHSEAMASQHAMHSRLGALESKVIPMLEKLQARTATNEQLQVTSAATDEQLQVLIQEMKALQEKNRQLEELISRKKHILDQKDLNDLYDTATYDNDNLEKFEWWKFICPYGDEREDELLDAPAESAVHRVKVTIAELLKANKELEEKVKAIAREDTEVVARRSAASKTTGGRTHKANKSVRFRDVSNTQPSKTQLSRPKNTTKGIAPDCLKRADAKKEGILSRREEIERSKAKNSHPSMRF